MSADVRGKTVLEVLRQHELDKLIETVAAQKQVLGYELKLGGLSERWLQINAAGLAVYSGLKGGRLLCDWNWEKLVKKLKALKRK